MSPLPPNADDRPAEPSMLDGDLALFNPSGALGAAPPAAQEDHDEADDGPAAPERPTYLGPALDDPRLFLDGALKWVGLFLLLSAASPLTFVLGVPRFLWELLPDDVARAWPSLVAFPLLGASFLFLRTRRYGKGTKAVVALALLLAAGVVAPLSRDVTEGLFNGLPFHFWRNSPLYLAACAPLPGSGLASRLRPRRAAPPGGTIIGGAAIVEALASQLLRDPPCENGEVSPLWRDRLLAEIAAPVVDTTRPDAPALLAGCDLA